MGHKMSIVSAAKFSDTQPGRQYHIRTLGAPVDEEYKNFNEAYAVNPSYCCGSKLVAPSRLKDYNQGVTFAFSDAPITDNTDPAIIDHFTFPDGTVLNIKLSTQQYVPYDDEDD